MKDENFIYVYSGRKALSILLGGFLNLKSFIHFSACHGSAV